ncbi:hypothetical protein ACYSNO_01625 [Enterococcus sp. LJL98]
MKKKRTYVPMILFLLILLMMKESVLTSILLIGFSLLIVLAKYQRQEMKKEENEYDDRVNQNITKWSLRSLYVCNSLLILLLFLQQQEIIPVSIPIEGLILFLIFSLCLPFYLIPAIIKHF